MMSLRGRQDGFRLLLPKEFICPEIVEKYTKIIQQRRGYYVEPIEYLNETIQGVNVLGFNQGTFQQQQPNYGKKPLLNPARIKQNEFAYPASEYSYRSQVSPIELIDKTCTITFRHTLGFLNYFLVFENFFYLYTRDRDSDKLIPNINIDIFDEKGSIYSRIVLIDPVINGIDMLNLNFNQPVAQSQTFNVELKYSNFDFQFIEIKDETEQSTVDNVEVGES